MSAIGGEHRRGSSALVDRCREARDLAATRLLELRTGDCRWNEPVDNSALCSAAYVVMLRATGLIAEPGEGRREARLLRHMLGQRNSDGGFYKYPTSPSCPSLTRLVLLAMSLALGERSHPRRPASWQAHNSEIGEGLRGRLAEAIADGRRYLANGPRSALFFELDHLAVTVALEGLAVGTVGRYPSPFLSPEFVAWAGRTPRLERLRGVLNAFVFRAIPALSILYRRGRSQAPEPGPLVALIQRWGFLLRRQEASITGTRSTMGRAAPMSVWWRPTSGTPRARSTPACAARDARPTTSPCSRLSSFC
jgi:hypothetical protein